MPAKRPRFVVSLKSPLAATTLVVAWATLMTLSGCRGRAHDDLYSQKMASEIRVLEDQLYEADYQNRVLRDKLERSVYGSQGTVLSERDPSDATPSPASPTSDEESDAAKQDDDEDDLDFPDDIELPSIDPGIGVSPEEMEIPDLDSLIDPGDDPSGERLPAPGGPEPPGADDLAPPPIIEGELLPPTRPDGEPEKPPGQIPLPDTAKMLRRGRGYPERLQIHPGLSGGYQFDEDRELDGLMIVVNVVDEQGDAVNLSRFDIDAELTVVAIDPTREPSEARVGRWEFSPQQVHDLVKSHPVSSLHIPIPWQQERPAGEEVIVHVRLKADEEEMRCERKLLTNKPAESKRIADWTPRGEKIEHGIGASILVR